jgi:phosphohistidine phosphatase
MELYVLRHGRAEERGADYPDDSRRPLTPEGRERIVKVAAAMALLGVRYDRLLTSPFARARETAEIVARAHGTKEMLEEASELAQGRGPEGVLRKLRRDHAKRDAILLVGHEPDLGELVSELATGASGGLSISLKKGGLVKLDVTRLASRSCASLEWMLTPRQMMRMT